MSIPFMVIFVCAWYFKMLIPMLIWCVMFLMLRNYIGGLLLINIFTEPVIHDENLKGYKRNYCKIGVVIILLFLPRIHADFQHGIVNDFANSRTVRAFTDSNEKVHFLEKKDAHENHQQHYREAG